MGDRRRRRRRQLEVAWSVGCARLPPCGLLFGTACPFARRQAKQRRTVQQVGPALVAHPRHNTPKQPT